LEDLKKGLPGTPDLKGMLPGQKETVAPDLKGILPGQKEEPGTQDLKETLPGQKKKGKKKGRKKTSEAPASTEEGVGGLLKKALPLSN
jgi:hypothetical protein